MLNPILFFVNAFHKVEQPQSSCLRDVPYIAHILTNMAPCFMKRIWMGSYGHWCPKPTQLFGTWYLDWTWLGVLWLYIRTYAYMFFLQLCLGSWSSSGSNWFVSWPTRLPKENIKLLHYLRPALTEFNGYLPRKAQRLLSLESTGMYTRVINADGKVTVTGGKRLKESGAYTKSFGKKVANLFKKKHVTWHYLGNLFL